MPETDVDYLKLLRLSNILETAHLADLADDRPKLSRALAEAQTQLARLMDGGLA